MCGRITLRSDSNQLRGYFKTLQISAWDGPRYNIAPTQEVATLMNDNSGDVRMTRWGLIPSWAAAASIGNRMINARAETLLEKPAFKRLVARQRCAILADGFYEWKTLPNNKVKQPVYITLRSGEVFGLAGLWDQWTTPEGAVITSSTIITTSPNDLMAGIHNRMPVILQPECVGTWLSAGEVQIENLIACLMPYLAEEMQAVAVSTTVNNARMDSPECVIPVVPIS